MFCKVPIHDTLFRHGFSHVESFEEKNFNVETRNILAESFIFGNFSARLHRKRELPKCLVHATDVPKRVS